MEKKADSKIKRSIFILIFALVVIIITIIVLLVNGKKDDVYENQNETSNIVEENEENNISNDSSINTINQKVTLDKINSTYTYFLLKECLGCYYETTTSDAMKEVVDEEALELISVEYISWVKQITTVSFCMDKIYGGSLNSKQEIYIVYIRTTSDSDDLSEVESSVIMVKIDTESSCFSIYPYEYVELMGYSNLAEGDEITIQNTSTIEELNYNSYSEFAISTDNEACAKELFLRYKFDYSNDIEHLYNTLDEEYREARYSSLEDFEQYIEENKNNLYQSVAKYNVTKTDDYVQYTDVSRNNRYYIFRVTENLMEYTLFLDNYTVITIEDTYENSLDSAKGKYCIQRIMDAINDENYTFVYEKLNPILKNNYYKTEEEFIEFIENNLYDENDYEIDEDYLIVSSSIYQYTVTITDANNSNSEELLFTMTINLKDDTDFTVSIIKQ